MGARQSSVPTLFTKEPVLVPFPLLVASLTALVSVLLLLSAWRCARGLHRRPAGVPDKAKVRRLSRPFRMIRK